MADAAPTLGPTPRQQKTQRQKDLELWARLDYEYDGGGWKQTQRDICTYMQPYRGRFFDYEQNRGNRKDAEIVNDTATDAGKKLAAAFDTSMSNPVTQWFRLSTADPQEEEASAEYLHLLQDVLFEVIGKSNFYKGNRALYLDLIGPGTGLMFIEEDDEEVIRTVHVPCGQYRLAVDARGRVSVVMRHFSMTVAQIVEKWCTRPDGTVDLSKCSVALQTAYENDRLDQWFGVMHIVERRKARAYGKIDKKNKPWASRWWEWNGAGGAAPTQAAADGSTAMPEDPLYEDGYNEQPFVAPRWDVVGEDAYGKESPGWQCIGDVKALQSIENSSARTIAKLIDPPMNATDDLKDASLLPGAVNYLGTNKEAQFTPAVKIEPESVTVQANEKRVFEHRITRAHYGEILFLFMQDQAGGEKATAEEVRAKLQERLLQLGGVFARIADEALKIAINRILAIVQRRRLVPPPPPALRAKPNLRIEFQNVLVSAQKTLGLTAVDQLVAGAGQLVEIGRKDALDELDVHEIMRARADMLGVKPNLLLSDEALRQLQAEKARQAQAQAQGAAMATAAKGAKDFSQIDPDRLNQLLQQFGPAALAQATGQP